MRILTPDVVKAGSKRAENEQRNRVRGMSQEEERLVKSINDLREEEKEELQKKKERETMSEAALGVKKTVLQSEVESLEARKAAALRPVHEVEMLVVQREQEVSLKEKEHDQRVVRFSEANERLSERIEKADDRDQEMDERDEAILLKEKGIEAANEQIKKSAEALSGKWVEYHDSVSALNARGEELDKREALAAASEKANVIRAAELDEQAFRQSEKERQIASQYEQLEKASDEIYKLKNQ